jgi:hypothetical protein
MPGGPARRRTLVHQVRSGPAAPGSLHEGAVWTTDAIFRETVEKVKHYQPKAPWQWRWNCPPFFTVAAFRRMEAAGILVVSDELSDYQWRPGFKSRHSNRPAKQCAGRRWRLAATWMALANVKEDD